MIEAALHSREEASFLCSRFSIFYLHGSLLHSLVCDGSIAGGDTRRDGDFRFRGGEFDDDLLGGHSRDQGVRTGNWPEL